MKYSDLNKLGDLLYLNKQVLSAIFPDDTPKNIGKRLSYLSKTGKVIRLKRDTYVLKEQYDTLKSYPEYLAVLACALKKPSYLSLEYVLRKYEVLTEATYGFTLVTTKKRATFENDLATFSYKEIAKELFTGYEMYEFLDFQYYEATKAKALFDWLYYRLDLIPSEKDAVDIAEDLRLNWDAFTKNDFKEMKKYALLSPRKEIILNIINNIEYYAHYHK